MKVQERQISAPAWVRLDDVLAQIAGRAADLDQTPRFPSDNFEDLASAGALAPPEGSLGAEVRLVRAVAYADASTARILDGHINALERLALAGDESLVADEVTSGPEVRLLGVWGADPDVGEGDPAWLDQAGRRMVLRGVKTFCSGAGGVSRALVVAGDQAGQRRLAYVDVTDHIRVDRAWYRASGMRSSESHRVEFLDTPVIELLGGPDELARDPWFSRDAVRTAATWAGAADRIVAEVSGALAHEIDPSDSQTHIFGRMLVEQATIDRWLDHAVAALDDLGDTGTDDPAAAAVSLQCRVALQESALLISGLAARACGSRALIGASALDRARRDLELFALQHRLDSKLTALGAATLSTNMPNRERP